MGSGSAAAWTSEEVVVRRSTFVAPLQVVASLPPPNIRDFFRVRSYLRDPGGNKIST